MFLHRKLKISKKMKKNEVILQKSMGCLGQVTKQCGYFFPAVTYKFVIGKLPDLKWYKESLAIYGVQPTCEIPGLASSLIRFVMLWQ